ncbi:MAG: MipA/OmpV family protein [Inhella sp.]|uniref:MipA/OmpV family protein n=1 Tax=Inhella sp. TaxID=1921806 RepID=UPI00391A687A
MHIFSLASQSSTRAASFRNLLSVRPLLGLVAASMVLASGVCRAQDSSSGGDRTRYSIGAAVLLDKDGYRGVGTETLVVPGLAIQNKWVNLYGPQLDLRLVGDDKRSWWIGPRIEYRFDGYEKSDSVFFSGMADRKGGLFYGLAGSVELGNDFELEADYVTASSKDAGFSRGAVASVALSRSYQRGAWTIVPRIGLEFQSSRYVDYYYGVRPGEATVARPAYAGKSTWSPELGLLVRYRATPRQFVFANVNYERYADQIRKSPLMKSSGIPQVVLGYQYVLN